VDDRPDVLATKRRGEPAWNEAVYDLHALEWRALAMTSISARPIGGVPWSFAGRRESEAGCSAIGRILSAELA